MNQGMIQFGSRVFDWLVDEQYRQFKKTGKEPTQDELIRALAELARHPEKLELAPDEECSIHLSEETCNYLQLLTSILGSSQKGNFAAIHQNLHKIYLSQQAAVLESAQQKSKLHAARVIGRFLTSGRPLRWGHQGWEVQKSALCLTADTVKQLNELGFIIPGLQLAPNGDRPNEFVRDLLSNQGIEGLDAVSRRAFRANQNRAYFEYLNELRALYQQCSTLREGNIRYALLVREKFQVVYHFAWLYLAGLLHLFGITEELRLHIAGDSLQVIGSMIE